VSDTFEPGEVFGRSVRFVDAPYRATFRRTMDPELQKILTQACGDNFDGTSTEAGGLAAIQAFPSISYDCSIESSRRCGER